MKAWQINNKYLVLIVKGIWWIYLSNILQIYWIFITSGNYWFIFLKFCSFSIASSVQNSVYTFLLCFFILKKLLLEILANTLEKIIDGKHPYLFLLLSMKELLFFSMKICELWEIDKCWFLCLLIYFPIM